MDKKIATSTNANFFSLWIWPLILGSFHTIAGVIKL